MNLAILINSINEINSDEYNNYKDPEILTRISQYEMAYRMQIAVPEVMNINDEPDKIKEMYGVTPGEESFANNCLLARKMVSKGVRFVQLYDWGWDSHGDNEENGLMHGFKRKCQQIDRPVAALILDLKQRGLLDETLVVWGGEFGRGSYSQGTLTETNYGRDHHPKCFTIFMAGAGIKKGITIGSTDDFGYNIKERPVHIHDLQATLMHLLGIDHERLIFKHQGRRYRLTDVHGSVVKEILS